MNRAATFVFGVNVKARAPTYKMLPVSLWVSMGRVEKALGVGKVSFAHCALLSKDKGRDI